MRGGKESGIRLFERRLSLPGNRRLRRLTRIEDLTILRAYIHSPRFVTACENLGILPEECTYDHIMDMEEPQDEFGRQKRQHCIERLLRRANRVIEERARISITF